MTTLDRRLAPPAQPIHSVSLVPLQSLRLGNGLPVHLLHAGQQPVGRVELVFEGGSRAETVPNTAFFGSRLLSEGTRHHTAAQIAERFDRHGAFLEISPGTDRTTIALYALGKHFAALLPLLAELVQEAVFPETELEIQRNIALQSLKVSQEKTATVAGWLLREKLFGADHPYGRHQTEQNVQAFTRTDVVDFYERVFHQKPFQVFVSGNVPEVDLPLLEAVFGTLPLTPPLPPPTLLTFKPAHTGPVRQTWPGKMQSSLRLGRLGPNRSHPDYFAVLVANEVFGGYFGSRLMKNIREEKGYTYGIYSQLTHLQQASYWSIGTDVNREVAEATMNEIGREMALMQQHPVEETELSTAKNYMIGQFAGSLNTPFEIADRHKTRLLAGLPADYYEHFVENVRAVTPEQVQEAASRYLGVENWQQIAIG